MVTASSTPSPPIRIADPTTSSSLNRRFPTRSSTFSPSFGRSESLRSWRSIDSIEKTRRHTGLEEEEKEEEEEKMVEEEEEEKDEEEEEG